jgi:hypothetical protein
VGLLPPSMYISHVKKNYIENKKKYDGFEIAGKLFLVFLFFVV